VTATAIAPATAPQKVARPVEGALQIAGGPVNEAGSERATLQGQLRLAALPVPVLIVTEPGGKIQISLPGKSWGRTETSNGQATEHPKTMTRTCWRR